MSVYCDTPTALPYSDELVATAVGRIAAATQRGMLFTLEHHLDGQWSARFAGGGREGGGPDAIAALVSLAAQLRPVRRGFGVGDVTAEREGR